MPFFDFLKDDSKVSTTRVVYFMIALGALLLIGCACFNIIWQTLYCASVPWEGISLLLASLSSILGVVMYGKVQQKRIEKQDGSINKDIQTSRPE
jgi:hypothetical protein